MNALEELLQSYDNALEALPRLEAWQASDKDPTKIIGFRETTLIVHPEQLQGFNDRAVARAAIEALTKKHGCSFEERRDGSFAIRKA
ncbi:hypothetical protein V1291_004545 [Nitrobacteraceae bacterium AZCC 1564]